MLRYCTTAEFLLQKSSPMIVWVNLIMVAIQLWGILLAHPGVVSGKNDGELECAWIVMKQINVVITETRNSIPTALII